jgi:LmbE family N-acetylglucosaminyl deacetylase
VDYERIIVFGAHPDDELRMAPAMAKMAAEGTQVVAVIFTDGCEGYPDPSMRDTIVATRAKESDAACEVLGIDKYVNLGAPDMGLENTKAMLKKVIKVIREVRPQAIFTHGENERHRDHIATHELSLEASWHAGEPVAAELGEFWKTPHIYYYKNTKMDGPAVLYDATDYAHIVPAVYATQGSQHVLFQRTKESYLAEVERVKANPPSTVSRFILHPWTTLREFPPVS